MTTVPTSVNFTTLTKYQLERIGIEITEPYTYQGDPTNTPFDPRLGTLDNAVLCSTCGMDVHACPGHLGYIKLSIPVVNPKFADYVKLVLNCVCCSCSSLLIQPQTIPETRFVDLARLRSIKSKCDKIKECEKCGTTKMIISEKNMEFTFKSDNDTKVLTHLQILNILKKVSNDTMYTLGFNRNLPPIPENLQGMYELDPTLNHPHATRPEAWVFENFPVVPPQARPYIIIDGDRKDDDLTEAYNNVIKANKHIVELSDPLTEVKTKKGKGKSANKTLDKYIADLKKHIYTLIDNKNAKNAATERKTRSITERVSGKEGNIQSNVGGKRVNFSARTVIDGAGYLLELDEIGVPEYMAKILTVPEQVTKWNKNYFEDCIRIHRIKCVTCKKIFENEDEYEKHTRSVRTLTHSVAAIILQKYIRRYLAILHASEEVDDARHRIIDLNLYPSSTRRCRSEDVYFPGTIVNVKRKGIIIVVKTATKNYTQPFTFNGVEGLCEKDIIERELRTGDPALFNRQPTIRVESMQGVRVRILKGEHAFRVPLCVTRPYNADFDGDEMNLHIPQSLGARVECATVMHASQHIVSRQGNAPVMGAVQNTLVSMYMLTNTFKTGVEHISREQFSDIMLSSHIDMERIYNLAKRVYEIPEYQQYVTFTGTTYYFSADKIDGRILASIVFPDSFTWSRKTDTCTSHPIFRVARGVIMPDSGPMCKKIIGGTKGSAVHALWKLPYSPSICSKFVSELQYIGIHYLWKRGFTIGLSDCLPTSLDVVNKALAEAYAECDSILRGQKEESDKEIAINSALNKAMGSAAILARTSMMRGEKNALVCMKVPGAKGSDVNNGQISGFTGQQNLDGGRITRSLGNGTRCLPIFEKGDNTPEARGFISNSLISGLTPAQMWFYSVSGRRGGSDTAMKTADTGYIQKKIGKKLEDYMQHIDATIRDANNNIIQFVYGGDGCNGKKLIPIRYKGREIPFFVDVHQVASFINTRYESTTTERTEKRLLFQDEVDALIELLKVGTPLAQTEATEHSLYTITIILSDILLREGGGVKVYDAVVIDFVYMIQDIFEDSKSNVGEAVGLIAACSIGEPSTQMTLNTHQFVGVSAKDVTMGVPRLNELLNATYNPSKPTTCVYLKSGAEDKDISTRDLAYKHVIDMLELRKYDTSKCTSDILKTDDVFFIVHSTNDGPNIGVFWLPLRDLGADGIKLIDTKLNTHSIKNIIVVITGKVTPHAEGTLKALRHQNKRIEIFTEKELQFDPTKHVCVPKHVICSKKTKDEVLEKYAISVSNLPIISTSDPIARRLGVVKGQLVKIARPTGIIAGGTTAGGSSENTTTYEISYRLAVDVPKSKKKMVKKQV